MQRSITNISIQHRILRHLLPDEINSRQDQILEADPETCRWILEPAAPHAMLTYRQQIHEFFVRWLRTGNDVLHISGNPGSGKSTLMKFIAGNSRTQEALRAWAGNKQLIFAQFYLWTAGTEAQRNLPGLLGSLLFQVLSQHPDLIEAVFPSQFKHMSTSQSQPDYYVEKSRDFNSKKRQEAFDLLLTRIANSEFKVFFLIDGLDEFGGGDLGHEELAERLKSWTTGGDIKLLVSSRPWRPFLTTFTEHRTLHLHELNHVDIKTYAVTQLCQDREIRRIGLERLMTTIEDVVEEISSQAQGIFLWAHLVLDSIRLGIRRRYSVYLLKAKVQEYPSDLDDLYDALREPIEKSPVDKKLSNRMLLLAAAAPKDFPLYALALSWLPEDDESGLLDPSFPDSAKCQPYSDQEIYERLQLVTERINGLTRGLLQPIKVPTQARERWPDVEFCHRTARDYLIANVKRYSALEESWPGFHQSDPYGRIYLADLIYTKASGEQSRNQDYLREPFCRHFKLDTIRKFEEPMRPYASYLFSRPNWYSHHWTDKFAFLRYAAWCSLDSFVLSEAASFSGAYPDPHEMTILLAQVLHSAVKLRNSRLALDLLRMCLDRNLIVEADMRVRSYPVHPSIRLHVWIVALICGLREILEIFSTCFSANLFNPENYEEYTSPSLLEVCRLLDELAVKLGQRLSVTVEVEVHYCRKNGKVSSFVDDTKRTFSAARLLGWAERLDRGAVNVPESEDTKERSSGWVLGTAHTMREENFPGANSQDYRVASWNLASTSGSIDGKMSSAHWHALLDFL